jgi:CO/xanthine dehydrogenase Mo-binding subunit
MMEKYSQSRRSFLKKSGALVVSFSLPAGLTRAAGENPVSLVSPGGKPRLIPDQLDSWIAILPDGSVTAFFGKMDMGQGVDVAVAQMVAEELDVAFDRVSVVMGDTAFTCNQGGASGSTGLQLGGVALRNAAAEARRLLVEGAAQKLNVPPMALVVEDGVVIDPASGESVSYGELTASNYFEHKLDWNEQYGNRLTVQGTARPKDPSMYRVVGKSFPQAVITPKVLGQEEYVTDIKLDGMLHARVIRPVAAGVKLLSVDETSISHIEGSRVIREGDMLAVVADNEWDAVRAAGALGVTWSDTNSPFSGNSDVHDYIRAAAAAASDTPVNEGDVDTALQDADSVIEAEYEWPFQSHASMGPACAVADVTEQGAHIWTGTQKPHYARSGCASIIGLPEDKVRVTWVKGPGSYGRNDAGDAALEAALLSKLAGKPVRLQYMRREGTAWDPKGPAAVFRAKAGLDSTGKVIAYDFHGKGFTRMHVMPRETQPNQTLVGQLTGWPAKPVAAFQRPSEAYGFENKRYAWETVPPFLADASPLRTGHLRDPLGAETHFASESFIDEIAHAVNTDPVEFRLDYINDDRHADILKACAERAGWEPASNPDRGKGEVMSGRGVSYTERNGTVVAVIASVEVERESGRIWAKRFTVAHDCGQIINPDGIRLVIEGNVLQALSRTLFEEVRFTESDVTSIDWTTYPILDIMDAPDSIDIVLIDRPELGPRGAGEPSTRTVPAAIANAVFDATGVRLRRVPLTAARMKEALENA